MAYGVFIHRIDSKYDDVVSTWYQFPKQYLSAAEKCEGDWIVYYEPTKVKNRRGYFAVARVEKIVPDLKSEDMFLALIEKGTYLDFGNPVPFRENGRYLEQGLINDRGVLSGRAQSAVRELSADDFARIVGQGLNCDDDLPPVWDPFHQLNARDRVTQLTSRAIRDSNFRRSVLHAYDKGCAITGTRLINGGGRAEVEAAHIRPVDHDGPDSIGNGIALSRTAHWLFDRGLFGLADDLTILVSRYTNDPDSVQSMINETGKLIAPKDCRDSPRPEFVTWHRENCFKS